MFSRIKSYYVTFFLAVSLQCSIPNSEVLTSYSFPENTLSTLTLKGYPPYSVKKALCRAQLHKKDIDNVIDKISETVCRRAHSIKVTYDPNTKKIQEVICFLPHKTITLIRKHGIFAKKINPVVYEKLVTIKGIAEKNMIKSLQKQHVPLTLARDITRFLHKSGVEKFMPGSSFTLVCNLKNSPMQKISLERICFVQSLSVKKNLTLFGYKKNKWAFYDINGKIHGSTSADCGKNFCIYPVENPRITSYFGMRHHPMDHCYKMHKGVDFSAARGTPVIAAASGKIIFVGYRGGFGRCIQIAHTGGYRTMYAHLHKYAKNVRVGQNVHQSDLIGYVGSSGKATSNHLHFELLQGARNLNPLHHIQNVKNKIPDPYHATLQHDPNFKNYCARMHMLAKKNSFFTRSQQIIA